MSLRVKYSPMEDGFDAIVLDSGKERGIGSIDLEHNPHIVIDLPPDDGKEPVTLEVLWISAYLPLETNEDYCSETDTLTIGDELEKASLIASNGDLVLYWRPDPNYPDELTAIAIDIRNASKHLAPAIAANQHKEMKPTRKYAEKVR